MCQRQGELMALAVEDRLEHSQPFPGDGQLLPPGYSRFSTWLTSAGQSVEVLDHCRNVRHIFSIWLLSHPGFAPGKYWNELCANQANFPEFEDMDFPRMGDVFAVAARNTLARHVPYIPEVDDPGYTSRQNYYVYRHPHNPAMYVIEDEGREFKTMVAIHLLANPNFNLPSWYVKRLERAECDLLSRL
jgi:hypothetical protein